MSQRLRNLLHEGAEAAKVPELAEPAMQAGHRLRRGRLVAAGIAVAAATTLLSAGYTAFVPSEVDRWVPAVTDASSPWLTLPETMTFTDDYMYTIYRESAKGQDTYQLPVDPDFKDVGGWGVSPDGTGLSMIDADGLRIGEVSQELPPLSFEAQWLCAVQAWSPDSTEIMVADCAKPQIDLVFVSTTTGRELRRITDVGGLDSAVYTGDGEHIVWGNSADGYTIAKPDGTGRKPFETGTVPQDPAEIWPGAVPANPTDRAFSAAVRGVSFDGRYVCHEVVEADEPATDLASVSPDDGSDAADAAMLGAVSPTDCDYLVDTSTGEAVTVDGGTVDGAAFGPRGEMLLGVVSEDGGYQVRLLDPDGKLIDSRDIRSDVDGNAVSPLRSYL